MHHNHGIASIGLADKVCEPCIEACVVVQPAQSLRINNNEPQPLKIHIIGGVLKSGKAVLGMVEHLLPQRCQLSFEPLVVLMVTRTGEYGYGVEACVLKGESQMLGIVLVSTLQPVAQLGIAVSMGDAVRECVVVSMIEAAMHIA